ncbi:MAG TPA: adenylate/guanylate cyclase domain-containing protein [Gaiellaceae bacterium]|nr:adenylate/guanylate cyclase domain-containing protein [Gaiellaceae bacterium]
MGTTTVDRSDRLEAARAAAARHAWRPALEHYGELDESELDAADLEAYADAFWWTGRLDRAIDLRERAYAGFLAAHELEGAARVALSLAEHHAGRGSEALASGWFGTAARLLEQLPEGLEHARFLATQGMIELRITGDLDAALRLFEEALALAERLGSRDLQVLARSGKACALVQRGDVEQGLALHDETTAAAAGGAVHPYSAGVAYCATIGSCSDVGDYGRAAEWTEAANRWCDRLDVSGFPGVCRLHRAEILRLRGDWPVAEEQAAAACSELHDFDRVSTAIGYYEIGEIRRRRGDGEGAEAAYRQASELGREPQPGLALLRLAQGKTAAALTAVRRALEATREPLARLHLLLAHVEIAIAAGELPAARRAADELESIVDAYRFGGRRSAAFEATIQLARGRIALAEGDSSPAVAALRAARDGWRTVGAPYEAAQARLLLGLALRRDGDDDGAADELEAALAAFERLGAAPDASRAKELLGRTQVGRTFLFTDIVDSTRLAETLGAQKWKRLLERHDEVVRAAIVDAGGEIVKQTGDGFFASFVSPNAAVDAAAAVQRALDAEVVAPDVRIGVHAGDAFRTGVADGDYGGEAVHVAARIAAAAAAGEILVSRATLDALGGTRPAADLRALACKGLDEPVEVAPLSWR